MKWRYYRTGLYTEKKRSHWLKQWPIRKSLGDKKRRVVIGWRCNLDFVEKMEQSTWKRLSSNFWILLSAKKDNSFAPWRSKPFKLSIGWLFQRFDEVQITCSTRQLAFSYLLNPFLLATALTNEISLLFCIWTNSVVSPHPSDDIPWRVSDEKLWDESLTSR